MLLTGLWFLSRSVISPNPLAGALVFLIISAEMTTLAFKRLKPQGRSEHLRSQVGSAELLCLLSGDKA